MMKRITLLSILAIILIIIVMLILFQGVFTFSDTDKKSIEKDFTIILTNGSRIKLSSLVGKPILLEFMSIYCIYCIQEIYELKDISKTFSNSITIVSVIVDDEDLKKFARFKEKIGMNWIVGVDEGEGVKKYEIKSVPTLIIFDKNGKLIAKHVGFIPSYDLIPTLNRLV
jgi:thioredoxin-related protein